MKRIPFSQAALSGPRLDAFLNETVNPMPSRIRTLVEEAGRPREELIAMATLIVADSGGSIRTFSGGLAHENGWLRPYKARRLVHWQGVAQRALVIRSESDHLVDRIGTESIRVLASDGTSPFQYTCDVELDGPEGRIVVEVKRDERDLESVELRTRYAIVAEILRRCGIRFEIVFRHEIFVDRHHRFNAELFASRAFVHVDRKHIDRLEGHAIRNGACSTYSALAEALDPVSPLQGEALLQALTVRRRVEIDLQRPLRRDTPVIIH